MKIVLQAKKMNVGGFWNLELIEDKIREKIHERIGGTNLFEVRKRQSRLASFGKGWTRDFCSSYIHCPSIRDTTFHAHFIHSITGHAYLESLPVRLPFCSLDLFFWTDTRKATISVPWTIYTFLQCSLMTPARSNTTRYTAE